MTIRFCIWGELPMLPARFFHRALEEDGFFELRVGFHPMEKRRSIG